MTDSPVLPFRHANTAFGSNVVHLEDSRIAQSFEPQSNDAFSACRDLHTYWQTLRGTRQMPARSEFDPRGIETALACTFVAEKVAPSVARIRVAGSVLNEALGMDVRGMPITALFDPASRDSLAEATRDAFASPAMVVLELSARRGFNRKPLRARFLLLPMSDADGNVSRLVGCLDIEGGSAKKPCRFQIKAMRSTNISGDAPMVQPVETPIMPTFKAENAAPSYAFAEDASVFQSRRSKTDDTPLNRAALRLVVSND